ncbi:MAG: hypothetical protein Ct9H300mP31_03870 [Acidimicrobiaceae bacterium]|nr:MAG: hypothetical protein Ct9H300mP31_03870 [Acidimicrobiaceae bacterium]
MARVVVGGQHAGAPHAVRLQDIHRATHVVRRVHETPFTGLAITDEVGPKLTIWRAIGSAAAKSRPDNSWRKYRRSSVPVRASMLMRGSS